MRQIKYLVVHCTAGNQNESTEALKRGFTAPKPKGRGWKNYGYHFIINADGSIENITPVEYIANGVAKNNLFAIHISYKGGVEKVDGKLKAVDNRTEAQKAALVSILTELKQKFPSAKILGHRDFSPDTNKNGKVDKFEWLKFCPCFDAMEEYKNL